MELEGRTIDEAVKSLENLRRYMPYRFGGTYFIIETHNGVFEAYRTKCKAVLQAKRAFKFGGRAT